MARIFITGSADGLGQLAASALIKEGHNVVLHARNTERGRDAIKKNPEADSVLIGDLSNINETKPCGAGCDGDRKNDLIIRNMKNCMKVAAIII